MRLEVNLERRKSSVVVNLGQVHTSATISRLAESEALALPNGRMSSSRPFQTGDDIDASLDRIQLRLPYI